MITDAQIKINSINSSKYIQMNEWMNEWMNGTLNN